MLIEKVFEGSKAANEKNLVGQKFAAEVDLGEAITDDKEAIDFLVEKFGASVARDTLVQKLKIRYQAIIATIVTKNPTIPAEELQAKVAAKKLGVIERKKKESDDDIIGKLIAKKQKELNPEAFQAFIVQYLNL